MILRARKSKERSLSLLLLLFAAHSLGLAEEAAVDSCENVYSAPGPVRSLLQSNRRQGSEAAAQLSKQQVVQIIPVVGNGDTTTFVSTGGQSMNLKHVVENSLPDSMTYKEVFPGVDLKVHAETDYHAEDATRSGTTDGVGVISLRDGTSTDFKFQFTKSGSDSPVTLDELFFSMVNLLTKDKVQRQVTMLSSFEHIYLDPVSSVRWTRRNGTTPSTFISHSMEEGTSPSNVDSKNSLTWRMIGVSEFRINLATPVLGDGLVNQDGSETSEEDEGEVIEHRHGGRGPVHRAKAVACRYFSQLLPGGCRDEPKPKKYGPYGGDCHFFFTGRTSWFASDCKQGTTLTNISFAKVEYSNLAGHGPTLTESHGVGYKDALVLPDESSSAGLKRLDAVLMNTAGSYRPAMNTDNGQEHGFGTLSVKAGAVVNFTLTFKDKSLRSTPVEDVVLSFFDFARSPDGGMSESFTFHGASHAYVTANSRFQAEEIGKRYVKLTMYSNDEPHSMHPAPRNVYDLTEDQQSRGFAVEFSSVSKVEVALDLSGVPTGESRTLYFAAHSRLSAGREKDYLCFGK